jgi:hypothetical protein
MKMIKIEKNGDILRVNKEGLLQIIEMNPDKKSTEINTGLMNLIENYYGRFSVKQTAWIYQKVGFIIRVNKTLLSLKGFKDIVLE